MPDPGWWEALWPHPAKVLADAGIVSGMDVIDLCSGDGWFTLQIARVARHVYAVDIDAKLLEMTRVRLQENGRTNCTYVAADAYDIGKVIGEPVDHVFLANAFHGVPDKLGLAHVVHGVLKPGGLFAVVNWYARPREQTRVLGEPRGPATELRIDPAATSANIVPAGFEIVKTIDVSPHHYAVVYRRS